eukprot:15475638-Alexandrium_andersonii.AAC.1
MQYLPALTPNINLSELEQSNMHTCFSRSELELRGPRNDLRIDHRSSRGVRSAPFLAQMPGLTTRRAS